MGFYIETEVLRQKADWLVVNEGAKRLDSPPLVIEEVSDDEMIICVVENGPFDAAGIIFDQHELDAFSYPDERPRTWLTMKKEAVRKWNPHVPGINLV